MKILHGPLNVGNQPWVLSRAERQLGVASDLVVRTGTWLGYPADRTLGDDGAGLIEQAVRSVVFGMTAPLRYDVLHYYFGSTFLYPGYPFAKGTIASPVLNRLATIDLQLARWLGRKRFMTLQGCDVRLAGDGNRRNRWTMCAPGRCSAFKTCLDMLDDRRRYLISDLLPLFDRVFYLNPELGHVVPEGQFLPYANVEIERIRASFPSAKVRPRIVHAPSDATIKGTAMIVDALEQLKASYEFDLILVKDTPHAEALALYRSADIAIDQVLAGWYGGFAVEMMAMGRPVACYIRDDDMKFVPDAMMRDLPIFRIHPDRLVEDIGDILDRRAEWESRGRSSRGYVERWHNPATIAKAMLDVYRSPDSRFELKPAAPVPSSSSLFQR